MDMRTFQKDILRYISLLNGAVNNIRLYHPDHPQVSRYMATAYMSLCDLLRSKQELTFLFPGDRVIVNNQPIKADHPAISQAASLFRSAGIERVTFLEKLPEDAFKNFINCLALPEKTPVSGGPYLKIGRIQLKTRDGAEVFAQAPDAAQLEKLETLRSLRDTRYTDLVSIYTAMKRRRKIDIRGVDDMVKAFVKGFSHGLNPLNLLASLKTADEYTFTHVINVCILTMSQAERLGFAGEPLYKIGIASLLHDVGKLFIPDEVINKPGSLTKEERSLIETHALKGARYILELDNIPQLAVLGALEHHIRYDGSGYPHIKGGWKPNIVSQMIAISDVFDALRSRRSYSEPKPQSKIVKILEAESGTAFNPSLVNNFLQMIQGTKPSAAL